VAPANRHGDHQSGAATVESEDGSEMLWAVRIEADVALSLTIALGEVEDGSVEYRANNLVAIFSADFRARSSRRRLR
jgi:hypothetical protein